MLIRSYTSVPTNSKTNKKRIELELECDICHEHFTKHQNVKILLSRTNHYCDPECFAKAITRGGVVDEKRKQTCKQKYSADYYIVRPDVASASGKRAASLEVRERIEKTTLERHGVKCMFNRNDVRAKAITASHTPEIIEFQQAKIKETMLKRYGVQSSFSLPHVREKTTSPETIEKAYVSRKRNGTIRRSKIEIKFVEMLKQSLQNLTIEENTRLQKFCVDVHIVEFNTYIQFDGVYWHGLDRSIDEIRTSEKPQDKVIFQKWKTDRALDELCRHQNITLVRITDKTFNDPQFSIEEWIKESLFP